MDFVSAVEAAMEVEHFTATGCRGRIRLAVLVTARTQLAAAEERTSELQAELESHANQEVAWKALLDERNGEVERLRGLLRTWLSGHEGMHADEPCGYTPKSPLVADTRKAVGK
jgi:hypothetical protein